MTKGWELESVDSRLAELAITSKRERERYRPNKREIAWLKPISSKTSGGVRCGAAGQGLGAYRGR